MSFIIRFFEQLIEWNYFFSHDYGIAIVMITVGVRLLLLPLNIKQRKQISKQQENGMGMGGCITSLVQFSIMICLYNAIRHITAIECGTILLPWVSSLLVKDQTFILPMATLSVQILPQLYPYLNLFSSLKLQKQSGSTVVTLLIANSVFVFMIPAGIGLYCFISGLFQSIEQFVYHLFCVRKMKL